ncbi:MAG: efflux RND transporter permease subunit [Candidatus Auribacterota bacterium]|jgi:HAE1 family hydrophobic/amphiphilic exporter-1|uniref:Efflux RND transporter permease subunit n=1 Tax=Candidatus Auribacter fodinae TaxID=2093366 RepID=A0A3A4QXJ0_9BACT|nr:MAG: efflux RND transporter permease subunit [Candidatus Auribacter fodinae]
MGLPAKAVARPVSITMLFAGILIFGFISLGRLPVELSPSQEAGQISIIITVRGGMPPTEIESMITRLVEEAVGTVSNVTSISSSSRESMSIVVLNFESGTDMDFASLEVREKFSRIKNKLPQEANKPVIAKWEYSQNSTVIMSVTSNKYVPEMLRRKVDESFKSNLTRIDGVANVEVWGGRERKILVDMDQSKLMALKVSYEDVMNVLGANNFNLLVGEIENEQDKLLIRTLGLFNSVEDIQQIGIAKSKENKIIRVKDVADVYDGYLESTAYSRVNLYETVSIYVSKESAANTLQITKKIRQEVAKILNQLDDDIKITYLYDQGEFIELAITSVKNSLIIGALLAMAVLLLFLRDIASTTVIAMSIPISVVATFIFMDFFGITLNTMTLSGLALGTGMLVDNSIVVLENIFHRRNKGASAREAAIVGSEQVWLAILASTITTIAVFLPMIFIDRDIRMLYSGLALTVTFSILASLFVSLSLVPMAYTQFSKVCRFTQKRELLQKLSQKIYQEILVVSIRYRYLFLIVIFLLFALSVFRVTNMGMELSGRMSKDQFSINMTPPSGTKLEKVDTTVREIEAWLSDIPEIQTISSNVKRDDPKILVTLVPEHKRSRTKDEIIDVLREKTDQIPKFFIYYYTGAQESESKEIVIDVYGFDYEKLRTLANAMAKNISVLNYLKDIKLRMRDPRPEYSLVVDKQRASLYGMTVKEVADVIHGQMRGLRATKFHSEASEIETITRLREEDRKTISDLEHLILTTKNGQRLFLKQIAGFIPSKGPTEVYRKNKNRFIQVTASIGEKDLGSVAADVEKILDKMTFPKDYFYRFGGDYPLLVKSRNQLSGAIAVTIILVYMILASLFQSYYQPFIIMISVPLATVGVVLALEITDRPLSTSVFMGMIMLAGIVVNNAIILVDHANALKEQGKKRFHIIIQAGKDRLRPIFMTTTTTILGLIPMAMDVSKAADLWAPLAITVMGGLISSTFLTLIVVPNIYILFEDVKELLVHILSRFKKDKFLEERVVYE